MTTTPGRIDLHSHSLASDGQYEAREVARRAAAAGVAVWALTDHDTVAALHSAADEARALGMRFVPGIELSAFLGQREIHVLGHFVDPDSSTLKRFEDLLAVKRVERMRLIVERLAALGVRIRESDIEKFSGGKTIGRPHVARAMVEAGAASSVKEAFDRYLGEGRPAYVGRYRLEAAEAVALVRGAGGTATIAHPGSSKLERAELARLREAGVEGIEVEHADHPPSQRELFRRIAEELGFVPTAGSDFHGEAIAPDRHLGMVTMTEDAFARLEARRP